MGDSYGGGKVVGDTDRCDSCCVVIWSQTHHKADLVRFGSYSQSNRWAAIMGQQ
jgi:hypothetical protein